MLRNATTKNRRRREQPEILRLHCVPAQKDTPLKIPLDEVLVQHVLELEPDIVFGILRADTGVPASLNP